MENTVNLSWVAVTLSQNTHNLFLILTLPLGQDRWYLLWVQNLACLNNQPILQLESLPIDVVACIIITPAQRSCWGVYWFHSVHPCVRPSVSPSCIPCLLCSAYSSGWIHFIFFTRGQYWPSGIVVACVCPSVRQSVRHQVCPRDNSSPVQATITKFGP